MEVPVFLEVFLEGGSIILNGLKTSSGAYGDENLSVRRNNDDDDEEHQVFVLMNHGNLNWSDFF